MDLWAASTTQLSSTRYPDASSHFPGFTTQEGTGLSDARVWTWPNLCFLPSLLPSSPPGPPASGSMGPLGGAPRPGIRWVFAFFAAFGWWSGETNAEETVMPPTPAQGLTPASRCLSHFRGRLQLGGGWNSSELKAPPQNCCIKSIRSPAPEVGELPFPQFLVCRKWVSCLLVSLSRSHRKHFVFRGSPTVSSPARPLPLFIELGQWGRKGMEN